MGADPFCRRGIPVPILLSKLRPPFVALVVFCSVGRIGPSPPDRPVRTTLQKQGTPMGAHGVQIKRPSWGDLCFGGGVLSQTAPSFLRFLRLFAAKPGPARFRAGAGVLTADRGGDFYPQMTQIYTDEREDGEEQGTVSWPGPHLWKSCSPSVDDLSLLSNPPRRVKVPIPVVEQCRQSSEAPSFFASLAPFCG